MKKVFLFLCFVELFSCVRAEKNSFTKVTFSIPNQIKKQTLTAQQLNPNGTINPASLADINCYAVLVSGPESSLRQNTCSYKTTGISFPVGFYAGGFYSLSGATAGATTTFGLDIPSGTGRAISLIGFQVMPPAGSTLLAADICSRFKTTPIYENYVSDPYILAEATQLDMPAGGTQTVNMKAVFNSTYQVGDCKGPDFNSGSGQSPPAKFGIFMQDGVGSATAPLRSNSCVGLKIQLQDVNGNRADTSSNPTINAIIKNSDANGVQIGEFYRPGISGDACSITNKINQASADVTIGFNDISSGNTFSDNGLFFKPMLTASGDFTLEIRDGGSSIPMATSSRVISYDASAGGKSKYAIFDFFNNKSSASTTSSASPNIVKVGQCREGYLQFLDEHNVPMITTSISGAMSPIKISSSLTSLTQIKYFPTSSDCTNGTSVSTETTVTLTSSTALSTARFYYKINTAVTNFGFNVINTTINPLISTGDLTPLENNYWGAQ